MPHTPGPWNVMGFSTIVRGSNNRAVAECTTVNMNEIEAKANARLIAAAPDMLAALIDATESLTRLPDVDGAYRVTCLAQCRAAIKKAGGE